MSQTTKAEGNETLQEKFEDIEQIIQTFGLWPAELSTIVSGPAWQEMEHIRPFAVAAIKWGLRIDREKHGCVTFEVWFPVDDEEARDPAHAIIQFMQLASGVSEWAVYHGGLDQGGYSQWFAWLLPEDQSEILEEEAYGLIGDILKRFHQESAQGDLPPIMTN